MTITTTWHYPTRPGFVSAWDAAKADYDLKHGAGSFDALPALDISGQPSRNAAVRAYINRL